MNTNDQFRDEVSLSKEAEAILHVSDMQDAYSATILVHLAKIQSVLHVMLQLQKFQLVESGLANMDELNAQIRESLSTFETAIAQSQAERLTRFEEAMKSRSQNSGPQS